MSKNPYITEDLEFLAETAEKFAQKYIAPGFLARDQSRNFDRDLVKKMGEMGFIAPELPEQYGGQGMGRLAAGVIHEAIAKADLSFSYVNLLASLNGQILAEHGEPEVVEPWLRKLTAGEAIFSIGLTEPRGGSDAGSLRLKIERDGDEYVLNGEKTSISAADQADASVIFGRTGTVESGAHGVTAVLVPMNLPGITTTRFDCHGQRAIGRGSIFFDNVRVPQRNLVGAEGMGFMMQMMQFQEERMWACANAVGGLENVIQQTIDYTKERTTFGQPLINNQYVHFRFAELMTEVEALKALTYQACEQHIAGENVTMMASMAKLKAGRLTREVADSCLQYWGGNGFMWENPASQLYRDGRLGSIGGGADEIMLGIICKLMDILPKKQKG